MVMDLSGCVPDKYLAYSLGSQLALFEGLLYQNGGYMVGPPKPKMTGLHVTKNA